MLMIKRCEETTLKILKVAIPPTVDGQGEQSEKFIESESTSMVGGRDKLFKQGKPSRSYAYNQFFPRELGDHSK